MKKQIKLSKNGKLYLANITIDDVTGQVIDSSLKQVTFPEKGSLTFSVLLDNETKARYSVNLDENEFLAIRKKANNENSWLKNFIPYTAKSAAFCHAIFSEIQEINEMESTQLAKLESLETNETVVDLINSVIDNAVANRIRTLKKLQDSIDKYNSKHGTINDIFDFSEKLETIQGISCSLTKAAELA